jgi:hypothetical protein
MLSITQKKILEVGAASLIVAMLYIPGMLMAHSEPISCGRLAIESTLVALVTGATLWVFAEPKA